MMNVSRHYPPPTAPHLPMTRVLPLICLAVLHALVDAVAMFIEPLWPELTRNLSLSPDGLFVLLSVASLSPNFSQMFFGYLQDRRGSRYLLWLGPALAALLIPCLGLATGPVLLGVLLFAGYVAVGSFHPEAAVFAGTVFPERRTRGLAIFMFGGTIGLGLGPMVSGNLVRSFGAESLAWLVPLLLPAVAAAFVPLRKIQQSVAPRPKAESESGGPPAHSRWKLALLLLLVCSLRVVPNTGLTKALAFTLEARGCESNVIGNIQSLFLVSGSLGMLLVGARFSHGWERRLMVWSPLAAVPWLAALSYPECPQWLICMLLIPAGLILVGTTPVMVSYAHQLFPRDTGMASALTMGLSWGVSGLISARMIPYFTQAGHPEWLFAAFIPCILISCVGALLLPGVETAEAPAESDAAQTCAAERPVAAAAPSFNR
jgi:MFS transporter, FSR family, fosmidomycin resistance protein